ncbi:MAG TPA: carbohydrate kinase family protein [Candidatus Paceibacterota bacterium]
MFRKKKIDFLAIGDITTDAFIRLKDAEVHCNINSDKCELCVRFGDKIPYEFVEVVRAVGNSPNAAVGASRLGLSSALLTSMGDDQNGKECLEALKKDKVSTDYIKIEKGKPTNYHYVLWYGADRTILVKHTDYKYEIPKNMPAPKWIYLSSLGPSAEAFHQDITRYLKAHPETKLSFQPGTFQISLGYEKLKAIYQRTECFFCNLDEAGRILKTDEKDVKKLLEGLHLLGPKIVAITDGPNGAYAYDGKEACFTPQYPDPKPPYDRTGAGDAFSSTFTVALSLGKTVPEALSWGPVNSMSVVQYVGAQKGLLSMGQLEKYLTNAPASYKISSI